MSPEAQHILNAFHIVGGNATALERYLKAKGYGYSRKRIMKIMDQLGLPRVRRG